jgi:hypothetical protein
LLVEPDFKEKGYADYIKCTIVAKEIICIKLVNFGNMMIKNLNNIINKAVIK